MYSIRTSVDVGRPALQSTRLPDRVRERIRPLHCSLRTGEACRLRVRAFIRFHCLRHPRTLGGPEEESLPNARIDDRHAHACTHVPEIATGTVVSPPDALASPGSVRVR